MQGLQWSVLLAVALSWSASVNGQLVEPVRFSEQAHGFKTTEKIHGYFRYEAVKGRSVEVREVHVPDARFVKIHFNDFKLPRGMTVEVSNPDGTETYRYSANHRDPFTFDTFSGDDGKTRFSAMSISGDTAIVRIYGKLENFDPKRHRLEIDGFLTGSSPSESATSGKDKSSEKNTGGNQLETTCGSSDRIDNICYKESFPGEYDRSIAVALVITSSGEECTAWRVGASNRMFTAEHCFSSQADVDGSEVWFNYQRESCGNSQKRQAVKVTGGELLATDHTLDYALFTVNDFSSISNFGYLGLDVGSVSEGEGIFIPQHGLGMPKQLAIESDMNSNGLCQVDDPDHTGYAAGSDIGYFCDTTTSSSGSPVLSSESGKVIALHHLGGCFNSGTKVSKIWPQVSSHFDDFPDADSSWSFEPENYAPKAEFDVECDSLSCDLDASASSDSDGSIVEYGWSLGDGGSATGVGVSYEFEEPGEYDIRLEVRDNEGAQGNKVKTVSVSWPNTEPNASFSVQCTGTLCELDASASSDPDGHIQSWKWTLGDGASTSGEQVSYDYEESGTYNIRLTVKDNEGASDLSTHTITLSKPNEAPVALFNSSCSELECSFDASGSYDNDGSISAYSWNLGDGQTASGAQLSHVYQQEGSYTVTLTVEDDIGKPGSSSQPVTVEAPNTAPEANFSFSCNQLECNFDAGLSHDSDGGIADYQWNFGDGGSDSGESVNHAFGSEGSYAVTLTVTDDEGAGGSRTRTVVTNQPNSPPGASFSYECSDQACSFDASASRDDDGEIKTYSWDLGDGSQSSGRVITHEYKQTGQFIVTLTVRDDENAADSVSRSVAVVDRNDSPVASFTWSCSGKICTLDAGSSQDSDGAIARYDWDFGDGVSGQGQSIVHEYERGGSYDVTLKVTDSENASGTRSRTVKIEQSNLVLEATATRNRMKNLATLRWAGAESNSMEIYRDGTLLTVSRNDGKHVDVKPREQLKPVRYYVCEAPSGRCSNEVTLTF